MGQDVNELAILMTSIAVGFSGFILLTLLNVCVVWYESKPQEKDNITTIDTQEGRDREMAVFSNQAQPSQDGQFISI